MIYGNWVGIHKGFVKALPIDRKYSELEAAFSLSVDIDNNRLGSVLGYANQWSWNRKTVKRFLEDLGVEIVYPESLDKKQNQRGQIKGQIRDRSGTDKGQIRIIIDAALYGQKDRSGTDKGQIKDRSKGTTIDPLDPNPKPEPKKVIYPEPFLKLFTDYPNSDGSKSQTFKNWKATKKSGLSEDDIYTACINSSKRQEQNSTGEVYYFQLSNLLSAKKYRGDLQDLINWIPTPEAKKKNRNIHPDDQFWEDVFNENEQRQQIEDRNNLDSGSIVIDHEQ